MQILKLHQSASATLQAIVLGTLSLFPAITRAQLAEPERPTNDDFAQAIVITGASPEGSGSLLGATVQQVDDSGSPSGSIWWSWTPPAEGFYVIKVSGEGQREPVWENGQYHYSNPEVRVVRTEVSSGVARPGETLLRTWGGVDTMVFPVNKDVRYQIALIGSPADPTRYSFLLEPVAGPSIMEQPRQANAFEGGAALFTARAEAWTGRRPTYQWQRNGRDLPGQIHPMLLFTNVTPANAGWYRMSVTWTLPSGQQVRATSQVAGLVITRPPSPLALADGLDQAGNYFFHVPEWNGFPFQVEASTDLVHWERADHLFIRRHFERSTTRMAWDDTLGKYTFAWDERKDRWILPMNGSLSASGTQPGSPASRYVRIKSDWPATQICVSQLRAIATAKRLWGLDNGRGPGDATVISDVNDYVGHEPICPSGGEYTHGNVGSLPTCSIPGHVFSDED